MIEGRDVSIILKGGSDIADSKQRDDNDGIETPELGDLRHGQKGELPGRSRQKQRLTAF